MTTNWSATWSPTPAPRSGGSRTAGTSTAMDTSNTNVATATPGWSTSAGRTAGTRSNSPTAHGRGVRSQPVRSRATLTTRSDAAALAREVWRDPALQRATRAAGRRPSHTLSPRLLDARARLPRARARRRQTPGRQPDVEHRPPALVRDPERQRGGRLAEQLLGEQLFSGWGIRTLGSHEAGYNPLGYHTGTVWPHENSLIAAGVARYGQHDAAVAIASATLAAAPYFEHRLPEVFAGFPAALTSVPVAFPTASRPQAWAAGAPLLLLTTILSLEPSPTDFEVEASGSDRTRRHPPQPRQPATTSTETGRCDPWMIFRSTSW